VGGGRTRERNPYLFGKGGRADPNARMVEAECAENVDISETTTPKGKDAILFILHKQTMSPKGPIKKSFKGPPRNRKRK